jgi:hypothetical protein
MSAVTSASCCTDRLHLKTNNMTDPRNSFSYSISREYHYKFRSRLSLILCLFTENLTTIFHSQGAKVQMDDNALSVRKNFHKNRSQHLHRRTNRIHLQLLSGNSAAGRHLKRPKSTFIIREVKEIFNTLTSSISSVQNFRHFNISDTIRRECSSLQHLRYRP